MGPLHPVKPFHYVTAQTWRRLESSSPTSDNNVQENVKWQGKYSDIDTLANLSLLKKLVDLVVGSSHLKGPWVFNEGSVPRAQAVLVPAHASVSPVIQDFPPKKRVESNLRLNMSSDLHQLEKS